MTGNIQEILAASDAAKSLQMERKISDIFTSRAWDSDRSVYYRDSNTLKHREIDVLSRKMFQNNKDKQSTSNPTINVSIICECKSLFGSNLIFSDGKIPSYSMPVVDNYWAGFESEIKDITENITETIGKQSRFGEIYQYFLGRSHPDGSAIASPMHMPPPPVEIISTSFRETKGGKISTENGEDGKRISPAWSAIQSILSAVDASKLQSKSVSLDYIHGAEMKIYGSKFFVENVAYFFDSEVFRNSFFHPVIILNAKMWHLDNSSLNSISSARLFINNIDHELRYVDIVHEDFAESYIETCTSHFERQSQLAIAGFWAEIEAADWAAGEEKQKLAKALALPIKW